MSLYLHIASNSDGVEDVENVSNSASFTFKPQKFGLHKYKQWKVCVEWISWTNAVYNVAAKYNNNEVEYKVPGDVTVHTATIPDGRYSATSLIAAFKKAVIDNNNPPGSIHYQTINQIDVPAWEWAVNPNTLRFSIVINSWADPGTEVYIPATGFKFFGFPDDSLSPITSTTTAPDTADVNNGVTDYILTIEGLVKGTYIGDSEKGFLYNWIPSGKPGARYGKLPDHLQWRDVNMLGWLSSLRIEVVDQTGQLVEMPDGNSNPLSFLLHFVASDNTDNKNLEEITE